MVVSTGGEVDGAHAAASDLSNDLIGSEPVTVTEHRLGLRDEIQGVFDGRGLNEVSGTFVGTKQGFDLAAQSVVVIAGTTEKSLALSRRDLERPAKNLIDSPPSLSIHGSLPVFAAT